eukprot:COSAG06_NODE_412_length_16042_cov_52.419934_12_plen_139_part_00
MGLNRAWKLPWPSLSLSLTHTLSRSLCCMYISPSLCVTVSVGSTGGLHNFQEVWPDEGDVNMFKLAQTLHRSETPFLRRFYIKCIILPRQARDRHKENSKKMAFPIASAMSTCSCPTTPPVRAEEIGTFSPFPIFLSI